jgi:uncharacterized membrane protein
MPKPSFAPKKIAEWIVIHPAEIFVILALIFGVLICLRMPPLSGTDEFTHFPRAYQAQEGKFWDDKLSGASYGGYLPKNINNMVNDYRDLSRKNSSQELKTREIYLNSIYAHQRNTGTTKEKAVFSSDAVYSPWSFTGPILGIDFAHILHMPLLWYVYFGRIFTLLTWIGLTWLAIRLLPGGKWFLFLVALLPTSLVQAATISPDSLVNGLSWLIAALTFALLAKKLVLNKKLLVLLPAICILLATTKQGYVPIALLPLIIPAQYFMSKKLAWIWRITTALLLIAVSICYLGYTRPIVKQIPARQDIAVSYSAQYNYVKSHSLTTAWRIAEDPFTKNNDNVALEVVGVLTNRLIYLSVLVMGLLYLGLFTSLIQVPQNKNLHDHAKRLCSSALLILLGFYIFISLTMYLTFSPVGSSVVEGIHGRYFLPLLPLLLAFTLPYKKAFIKINEYFVVKLVLVIALLGLLSTVMTIQQ